MLRDPTLNATTERRDAARLLATLFTSVAGVLLIAAIVAAASPQTADARRGPSQPVNLANADSYRTVHIGDQPGHDDQGVCSADSAGDFNDDGIEDHIVGLCHRDETAIGSNAVGRSGAAVVVYGRPNSAWSTHSFDLRSPLGSDHMTLIQGPVDNSSEFGYSVAGGYDVNGDHVSDVVIGAPDAGHRQDGEAWVIYGKSNPDARISVDVDGTELGNHGGIEFKASTGGNDSQSDDLGQSVGMGPNPRDPSRGIPIIADPGNDNTLRTCDSITGYDCGVVWVPTHLPFAQDGPGGWKGAVGSKNTLTLNAPDAQDGGRFDEGCRIDGAEERDDLGFSVDGGPDVTGDHVADIVAGAPDAMTRSATGAAYVVSGAACLNVHAAIDHDRCARSQENPPACGVLQTYTSPPTGGRRSTDYFMVDSNDTDSPLTTSSREFGSRVAIYDNANKASERAVDINGDGRGEILVGDPEDNSGRESHVNGGAVWIIYTGSLGDSVRAAGLPNVGQWIVGADGGDHLGDEVKPVGDIDEDDSPDIAVSSANANGDRGAAYIIYGNRPADIRTSTINLADTNRPRNERDEAQPFRWTSINLDHGRTHLDTTSGDGGARIPLAGGTFDGDIDSPSDIVVGASGADPDDTRIDAGKWYLVKELDTPALASTPTDRVNCAATNTCPREVEPLIYVRWPREFEDPRPWPYGKITLSRKGTIKLPLTSTAKTAIKGKLTLKASAGKKATLATKQVTLKPEQKNVVTIKLASSAQQELKQAGKLKLSVTFTELTSNKTSKAKSLTIAASKAAKTK